MTSARTYDVCVVGAGLVGLAVAGALIELFDGISVLVLDKERGVAMHQSGRNSGVVHSGLYYLPGSLKARLCVEGRQAVEQLCAETGIPILRTGKLVLATRRSELDTLDELERRGRANGLTGLVRVGPAGIADIEPHAFGIEGLHVPETSVVDFGAIARHMAGELIGRGAKIQADREVTAIRPTGRGVLIECAENRYVARVMVNCAGLYSDRIARMAGLEPSTRIVPFRGEYYRMAGGAADLVRGLIYPVPDPRFPFLGVHFTRKVDGTVEVGPNAVLALGKEHYRGTPWRWSEAREIAVSRAVRSLAARYWRQGIHELVGSRSKRLYARQARHLLPPLRSQDLVVGGSGVRAQAVETDGSLVDDFVIESVGPTIHVLNAPSPGATASIAIGRYIARTAVGPIL